MAGRKSKQKGNRNELELAKILSKRFGKEFSRSIGSGNRWSQTKLTDDQARVFAGDLVCPAGFRFAIECKGGYSDLNIFGLAASPKIDQFLSQAESDAIRCGKEPLLCWRQTRQPWMVFFRVENSYNYAYQYRYRDWQVVQLQEFLAMPDEFFFTAD